MILCFSTYNIPLKNVTNQDLSEKHAYSFIARTNEGPVMVFGDVRRLKDFDELTSF